MITETLFVQDDEEEEEEDDEDDDDEEEEGSPDKLQQMRPGSEVEHDDHS